MRKIVILGTTGSGKTTFMKNLVGEFDASEVERNITIEEAQIINTFTPLDKEEYENSTTTVSMNVQNVLFLTTRTNQFQFYRMNDPEMANSITKEDMDQLFPTVLFDTAGQERFNFMQEIGIKGADGIIIFADGTNVQSIERISHYYEMVKEEEKRSKKDIPIVVFINKKDLEEKGMYIGIESVKRWIPEIELSLFETSNKDLESFNLAMRNFLSKIDGFPVDASKIQIKLKRVHEVY